MIQTGVAKSKHGRTGIRTVLLGAVLSIFIFNPALPASAATVKSSSVALQKNSMAMARSGQYQQAIDNLNALLESSPGDRSLKRDLLVVHAWAGQCKKSLHVYRALQPVGSNDRDLVHAVASCLIAEEFYLKAISVLTPAVRKYRHDRALQDLYNKARTAHEQKKLWFSYNGGNYSASDAGGFKTAVESEISRKLNDELTIYARLNLVREHDPVLADGELNRLGVGVDYRVVNGLVLREELSGSLSGNANTGVLSKIEYGYSERVSYSAEYATYAEDIPLPAIAQNIYSDRLKLGASFNSDGYVLEGTAYIWQYRFSDSNLRQGATVDTAFAYHRQENRWRRIGMTINHESNSLTGPAYFNPSDANTVVAYHVMELPRKTGFKKHLDVLTIKAGIYAQAGFASEFISELMYEQKYTLTDNSWLELGASVASNVYDGARETESSLRFSYARSF